MASVRHLGLFPFCIKELAEDGEPFEEWDQTTVFGGTAFDNVPSKSADTFITVYGSGTEYFIGLTLEELICLFWRPKQLKLVVDGEYQLSLPAISVTDGYWDNAGEWKVVPRTAAAINMTIKYPDDAINTNDTWNSPAETEKDLVCALKASDIYDPIWPKFDLYIEKIEETFDEEAVPNAYNRINFFLAVGEFDGLLLGARGVIKGKDGLYYPSLTSGLYYQPWFRYGATLYHYGHNATPATYPNVNIDVVYPFAIDFPAGFGYEIPASVDNDTLSSKELKFHIDFPWGRKTITTKLWGGTYGGALSPIPNIELVLSFEYWPYDPEDGGGPIYNSSTGARIRFDV